MRSVTMSPAEAEAFAGRAKAKLLDLVPHNIGADGRSEAEDLARVDRLIAGLEVNECSKKPVGVSAMGCTVSTFHAPPLPANERKATSN